MIKHCNRCGTETERNTRGDCKPCARAYYAANKEQFSAKAAAYRAANLEKVRAREAIYRAKNPEKILAAQAAFGAANPEKVRAWKAAYQKANPEKYRVYTRNRRARKLASGGQLSPNIEAKLLKLQKGKCACCRQKLGDDYHLDHIMPLALGGTNSDDNVQLLRARCNMQKQAKHPVEFMQQRGFLL